MFSLFHLLVIAFIGGLVIFPFWKIFAKAGFPGWLSFLLLFPLVNVGAIFYLALAEWPALRNKAAQDAERTGM